MELTYERRGDYYFPVFSLPEETRPIGLWGRRRREYLREHRTITFNIMVMNGTLFAHLADINEQAEARLAWNQALLLLILGFTGVLFLTAITLIAIIAQDTGLAIERLCNKEYN